MTGLPGGSPAELARARGIKAIVHFTTDKGILGTIRKGALLSRKRVQDDPDLAFIFAGVWPRRDLRWVDFVSLSVTDINTLLYSQAQRNLPDRWWGVLAFGVDLLDDDGVWFTTTNNIFPSCRRAQGSAGFEAMFAPVVEGSYQRKLNRADLRNAQPTDRAAEVLYPGTLAAERVQAVYVPSGAHRALVLAWCDALGRPEPAVEVRADLLR
jgi:ssDNA thymidine ADP-ribosyltransferase, DarT